MKRFISLPLILGFVGVTLFGFSLFDMGSGHVGGCAASIVDGAACPTSAADAASHHLSAWQVFTTTFVSFFGSLALIASLVLVSVVTFLFYSGIRFLKPLYERQRLRDFALNFAYSRQEIASWLSLFELSPAF